MRKARPPESGEQRQSRLHQKAESRKDNALAEDKAMDAAIRDSIKHFGA